MDYKGMILNCRMAVMVAARQVIAFITHYWLCFIPLVLAFLIDWSAFAIAVGLGPLLPQVDPSTIPGPQDGKYYPAFGSLSTWGIGLLVLYVAMSWLLYNAIATVWVCLRDYPPRIRLALLLISACLLSGYVCVFRSSFDNLGPETTRLLIDHMELKAPYVDQLLYWSNVAGFATMCLVAVAFGVILAPPRNNRIIESALRTKAHQARSLLWALVVFLFACAFEINALNRLPASVPGAKDPASISAHAFQIALLCSGAFILVIAALYGPVYAFIRNKAEFVARRTLGSDASEQQVTKYLEEKGFALTTPQKVLTALAALSPVGGPILDKLLEVLGKLT